VSSPPFCALLPESLLRDTAFRLAVNPETPGVSPPDFFGDDVIVDDAIYRRFAAQTAPPGPRITSSSFNVFDGTSCVSQFTQPPEKGGPCTRLGRSMSTIINGEN